MENQMAAAGLWEAVSAELSDLHESRAVGCLILSVEALVVTWCWPRLFPPRRRPGGREGGEGRRRHRRGRRSSSSQGGAWAGDSVSAGGGGRRRSSVVSSSSRRSEDSERWESEGGGGGGGGWSEAGRSSAPCSVSSFGGRSSRAEQPSLHARGRGTSGSNTAGRLESLSEQPKLPAIDGRTGPALPRKACARYARPLLLVLLTLSASYLTTCLLLSTSGAVGSTRKREHDGTAKALEEADKLPQARAQKAQQARQAQQAEAAAAAAAAAAEKARQQQQREAERREEQKRKERAAAAEKKKKKEEEAEEEARAAKKKRRQREEEEEAERARREQEAKEERRAEGERKARAEQLERRREQRERGKQNAREKAAEARAKAKAEADAEAEAKVKAKADAEAAQQQQREREARARAEAETARKKSANAKKASTLEQTESLGSERALSNGSTTLRVMPNGDLVLSDRGEPVWTALGSKKRRVHSVAGWIWGKIRRKTAARPCTECQLTVSPSGRVELRERNKIIWSDGQHKKKKKKKKKGKEDEEFLSSQQQASADGGAVDGTFRLVVTGDGNAVLERGGGGAEVVWKALDR